MMKPPKSEKDNDLVGLACLEDTAGLLGASKLRFSAPSMEFVWETDPEGKLLFFIW